MVEAGLPKSRRVSQTGNTDLSAAIEAAPESIAVTHFRTLSLNSVSVSMDYVTVRSLKVADGLRQHVWFEYVALQNLVILEMSQLGYNYHYGPPG